MWSAICESETVGQMCSVSTDAICLIVSKCTKETFLKRDSLYIDVAGSDVCDYRLSNVESWTSRQRCMMLT